MNDRNGVVRERLPASVAPSELPGFRLRPSSQREARAGRTPGRGEGDGLPVPMPEAANPGTGDQPVIDQDLDLELPTGDELLAEIGLDSYTIRRIRAEAACADAGEEERLFIG